MNGAPLRPIRILADCIEVPLTRGLLAYVDLEDRAVVESDNWHAHDCGNGKFYAATKSTPIYLHRLILDAPDDIEVDHRDGDGLNCRRRNLRLASHQQNQQNLRMMKSNTSGFIGVSRLRSNRWRAYIRLEGRQVWLGSFATAEEAAAARDAAAIAFRGEFARTNLQHLADVDRAGKEAAA